MKRLIIIFSMCTLMPILSVALMDDNLIDDKTFIEHTFPVVINNNNQNTIISELIGEIKVIGENTPPGTKVYIDDDGNLNFWYGWSLINVTIGKE